MKGLIYKDFINVKKQLISAIVLQFFFLVTIVIVALSSKYGNISRLFQEGMVGDARWVFDYVIGILIIVDIIIPMFTVDVFCNRYYLDQIAGFRKVSVSLPISINKKVASRYVSSFIFLGILLCDSLLGAGIVLGVLKLANVVVSVSFAHVLDVLFLSCMFLIFYLNLRIFLCYLFESRIVEQPIIIILVISVVGIFAMKFMNLLEVIARTGVEKYISEKLQFIYTYTTASKFILISSLICIGVTALSYGLVLMVVKTKDERI